MARDSRSLPLEHRGSLDFAALITTLESLAGEEVSIPVVSTPEWGCRLAIVGDLRRVAGPAPGARFMIGDSGYLLLVEDDFERALLVTLEGNFYFRIEIVLRSTTIELSDPELGDLSLGDYPWEDSSGPLNRPGKVGGSFY